MKIEGKRFWGGKITFDRSVDPDLELNEVVWLESKEPTLLRPIFRRRARVIGREDDLANGCTTYEFYEVPPDPAWSQRPDTARTVGVWLVGLIQQTLFPTELPSEVWPPAILPIPCVRGLDRRLRFRSE
jgi:hypothetical protein